MSLPMAVPLMWMTFRGICLASGSPSGREERGQRRTRIWMRVARNAGAHAGAWGVSTGDAIYAHWR